METWCRMDAGVRERFVQRLVVAGVIDTYDHADCDVMGSGS